MKLSSAFAVLQPVRDLVSRLRGPPPVVLKQFLTLDPLTAGKVLERTHDLSAVQWNMQAGSLVPKHEHLQGQVGYVLQGEFEAMIGGRPMKFRAGDAYYIPPRTEHEFRATQDGTVAIDIFFGPRDPLTSRAATAEGPLSQAEVSTPPAQTRSVDLLQDYPQSDGRTARREQLKDNQVLPTSGRNQFIYVLNGTLEVTRNGHTYALGPGRSFSTLDGAEANIKAKSGADIIIVSEPLDDARARRSSVTEDRAFEE